MDTVSLERVFVGRCRRLRGVLRLIGLAAALAALGLPSAYGGSIYVNSSLDGPPVNDDKITLREALLIARGDRQPYDNPVVGVPDEMALVSGIFGAGISDEILPDQVSGTTITLADYLPPLDDAADSIDATVGIVISGAALPADPSKYAFDMRWNNHSLYGLTLSRFPRGAINISGKGNSLTHVNIDRAGATGLSLFGTACTSNTLMACNVHHCTNFGVLIGGGAHLNTLTNVAVYGNGATGVEITGTGTDHNILSSCDLGVTDSWTYNQPAGNGGYGLHIHGGAKGNRLGTPSNFYIYSLIANNALGGILIDGAGTNGNLVHSATLGYDAAKPQGAGNGSGHGIEVSGGAQNTTIGLPMGQVFVLGHAKDGILVSGAGTNGTEIYSTCCGVFYFQSGTAMPNLGHGIELADGAQNIKVGDLSPLTQVVIDHSGSGKHGLYLNGSNASVPLKNIRVACCDIGTDRQASASASIGGDALHIDGNVDGVTLGVPGGRNHCTGAAGYGVSVNGPNVRNVSMAAMHAGEYLGQSIRNDKGGIYLGNGTHDVTIGDAGLDSRCYLSGNDGPGLTVGLTGLAPANITLQNSAIGLSDTGTTVSNKGDGVAIRNPLATTPQALTGIHLGTAQAGTGNFIATNTGNGIYLQNVSGVTVEGNFIGTSLDGKTARPNALNGILVERCEKLVLGSDDSGDSGNLLSGNRKSGLRITKGSQTLTIQHNLIGSNAAGDGAVGNQENGITIEAPGPSGGFLTIGGDNVMLEDTHASDLGQGNLISGNLGYGILATTPAGGSGSILGLYVSGNLIGTNLAGTAAVGNGKAGVGLFTSGVKEAYVGDLFKLSRSNLISGNATHGVEIDQATGWHLWNNAIGTSLDRAKAVANQQHGIRLSHTNKGEAGATGTNWAGNVISGNGQAGIHFSDEAAGQLLIAHNLIGTDGTGKAAVPNQYGILVEGPNGAGADTLIIGGNNPAIPGGQAGPLNAGNLISGNWSDGIRVQGTSTIKRLKIQGNIIGLDAGGAGALPNAGCGIGIQGSGVQSVTIGDKDTDAYGNIISGNTQDGVQIDKQARQVELYHNLIGTPADPEQPQPNSRHGLWIRGGASLTTVQSNTIRFNKNNGIKVSDAATVKNTFSDNSIHRNEKEGILILDGANGGIKAPVIERLYRRNRPTNQVPLTTAVPNGKVEVFVDPPVTGSGTWGQGKKRVQTQAADGTGKSVIPFNFPDEGVLTATVTDAAGNTSEFSPMMTAIVVQTLHQTPDLLVANKPAVIRVYTDTGRGSYSRQVTGQVSGGGLSAALSPTPASYNMAWFAYYDGKPVDRRQALDSMNFYVPHPPAGNQNYEVVLYSRGVERSRLKLGPWNFQQLQNLSMIAIPVIAPVIDGGPPVLGPNLAAIQQSIDFFGSVYPLDPVAFHAAFQFAAPVVLTGKPHDEDAWDALFQKVEAVRLNTVLPGGSRPRYAAGFVNFIIGLNGPGPGGTTYGLSIPGTPSLAKDLLMVDQRTFAGTAIHNGGTLCHEVGHTPPFLLGDTYRPTSSTSTLNPLPADPTLYDKAGIFVFEDDFPFSPTGSFWLPTYARPGPAGTIPGEAKVRDFMGNTQPSWIDKNSERIIFQELGGSVAGAERMRVSRADITPAMVVRGTVSTTDSVSLRPLTFLPSVPDDATSPTAGTVYTVELQDAAQKVLETRSFTAVFTINQLGGMPDGTGFGRDIVHTQSPFSVVLHDNPLGRRLVIKRGTRVLTTLVKSANAPKVTVTTPGGPGPLPKGSLVLNWTASDADPGQTATLWFDVLYSLGGGQRVLPLAVDLRATHTLTVQTDDLPGSASANLIVRASDGWNVGQGTPATPFKAANRPPRVQIAGLPTSATLYAGQPFALAVAAYDPEEGMLDDAAIVWTLDGGATPLAYGAHPTVALAQGTHKLRATAKDAAGNTAYAEITLQINAAQPSSLDIAAWLLGLASAPPAGADGNQDGRVDIGDVVGAVRGGR